MIAAMQHEQSYRGGEYINEDIGLYLGWTAHAGSFSDGMPVVSDSGDATLIFAGEHHASGRGPATARDIIKLYEDIGDEFVVRLNGWFSGVIVDHRRRRITIFNDRFGMHRIYVHEGKEEFLFASEAKALLRIRSGLRQLAPAALAEYLTFNCVMDGKTLFKDVSLLPPASRWTFERTVAPTKQCYFDFADWERQPILEPDQFYARFAAVVSEVFPAYTRGTQRSALSLTSGVDTRTILASLNGQATSLSSYTFGGLWGETFDVRTARRLARICNQRNDVIRIDERFLQDFPSLATRSVYLSDGTHDAFGAHDVYFNQLARHVAPIRVTGKFGSEVVRVRKLIPEGSFKRELAQPGLTPFLDEVRPVEYHTQRQHPLTRVVTEEIPWYESGRVAIEQSQIVLRSPYMDNELVKLMFQAPLAVRASNTAQVQYIKDRHPALSAPLTNLGRIGKSDELVSKLFYLAFWSLFKAEYVYLYTAPHWLTYVDRRLEWLRPERLLAGRQKFEAYRIWMRSHFSEFIRETLLASSAHALTYFDGRAVRRLVSCHIAGTHNYLAEIDKILTVELVCKSLLGPPTLETTPNWSSPHVASAKS